MTKPFWDLAGCWGFDDVAAEYYKYCILITQNIFSTTAEVGPRIYLNSKSPAYLPFKFSAHRRAVPKIQLDGHHKSPTGRLRVNVTK